MASEPTSRPGPFSAALIDSKRAAGEDLTWRVGEWELALPDIFGFCRGVSRALHKAAAAVAAAGDGRVLLLGPIIHNPWVNDYFRAQGVEILSRRPDRNPADMPGRKDTVIIPAFGGSPRVIEKLKRIGCRLVDCSCGDVMRVWQWSRRAVADGFGIIVYGRSGHDETVVTTERIMDAGGYYVVVEDLDETRAMAGLVTSGSEDFARHFNPPVTNAAGLAPFLRAAQVSQTTMLYGRTVAVRDILRGAYEKRFGPEAAERLLFQPTVCRATQDRQDAAVRLCESGCDLVVVIGGFDSSNTRHLHELAAGYGPAFHVESAAAIESAARITARSATTGTVEPIDNWLSATGRGRIGLLSGASTPDIVTGRVLERLIAILGD